MLTDIDIYLIRLVAKDLDVSPEYILRRAIYLGLQAIAEAEKVIPDNSKK